MPEARGETTAPPFGEVPGRSEEDRDIIRRARAKIEQLRGAEPVSEALQDRVASEMGVGPAGDGSRP